MREEFEASSGMSAAPATRRTRVTVRPAEGGYAAHGQGYYLWDESLDRVVQMAEALEGGRRDAHGAERWLVLLDPMAECAESGVELCG